MMEDFKQTFESLELRKMFCRKVITLYHSWKKVIKYPVSTETVYYAKSSDGKDKDDKGDSSINVNIKDGKQVNVSVTYSFHMDADNLPLVFTKFCGRSTEEIETGYIKNEMYQAINEVTNDFLKITATSFANIDKNNPAYQSREKIFLETVGKYNKETQSLFVDMTAELAPALEECIGQKVLRDKILKVDYVIPCDDSHKPHYRDVLGEIFHEFNLNDQKGGQVFTPQHTGNLMGAVGLTEKFVRDELNHEGFIKIREPCCGSEAITFDALNRLLEFGISPNYHSLIIASDIDERCVLMTYIQLSFYGIPAIVFQQNSITDEFLHERSETVSSTDIYKKLKIITSRKPTKII